VILVDTSVWVDHFRRSDATLVELLEQGRVATHPFVIGEIACGSLSDRANIIELMHQLPTVPVA
jgi:predicted nucleic acid-binding protein